MRYVTALVYRDGRIHHMLHGPEDQVNNNLAIHEFGDVEAHTRHLEGTDIANAVMIDDPRLPKTVAEFDARYPTSSAP